MTFMNKKFYFFLSNPLLIFVVLALGHWHSLFSGLWVILEGYIGLYYIHPPGAQAFGFGQELHNWFSWASSLKMVGCGPSEPP